MTEWTKSSYPKLPHTGPDEADIESLAEQYSDIKKLRSELWVKSELQIVRHGRIDRKVGKLNGPFAKKRFDVDFKLALLTWNDNETKLDDKASVFLINSDEETTRSKQLETPYERPT